VIAQGQTDRENQKFFFNLEKRKTIPFFVPVGSYVTVTLVLGLTGLQTTTKMKVLLIYWSKTT
jgi:hypothetical protein